MISSFTEYMIMHNVHALSRVSGVQVICIIICAIIHVHVYTCTIIYSCLIYMYSYLSTLKIRWMKLSDERKPKK